MAKFDKNKPYGECSGIDSAHFYQSGHYFDVFGVEVTESGQPIKDEAGNVVVPMVNANAKGMEEYQSLQARVKALGGKANGSKAKLVKFLKEHAKEETELLAKAA